MAEQVSGPAHLQCYDCPLTAVLQRADQDRHVNVTAQVYYASEFDACMGDFDATDIHGVTHSCYAFAKGENEDNYPGNHFVMHSACLLIVKRWIFEEGKSVQDFYDALSVYDAQDFRGVYLLNQHYGTQQFWEQDWVAKQGWEVCTVYILAYWPVIFIETAVHRQRSCQHLEYDGVHLV